jgi:hypothetical protein
MHEGVLGVHRLLPRLLEDVLGEYPLTVERSAVFLDAVVDETHLLVDVLALVEQVVLPARADSAPWV